MLLFETLTYWLMDYVSEVVLWLLNEA